MHPVASPRLRALTLLLAAAAAACAQPPSASTCATHADCPSGSTCQAGVCQEGLALGFGAPADQAFTRGAVEVQVTVAGQPPAAVQLLVDDGVVATLSPPFTYSLDTGALAERSHTLVAAADLGGRKYLSPSRTFVVDRTAPARPAVTPGTSNAADPVPISGTAEAGATVALHEGTTLLASGIAAGPGGAWSTAVALAEGTHVLTATATDAAGNVSAPSPPASVEVDRTPPAAPAVAPGTTRAVNPVPIAGTAVAGTTVTVYEAGALLISGVTVGAGGAWSTAVPLAEGTHALTATATDAAGNASALSAAASVVVDRTAPLAPTVAPLVTNAPDPVTITGAAEPGAAVTVYEGGAQLAWGIVAGAGGAWSTVMPLAEGTHGLVATATDMAGNVSALSAPASVVVNRTASGAPVVAPQITNAANPVTITGTAAAGTTVALHEGTTLLTSGIAAGPGGAWSTAVALAEGTHILTATATDAAGNVSAPSAPASVVVDRTPPAVPAVTPRTTRAVNPVPISGTAVAGSTVTVYEGGTALVSGVAAGAGGTWSTAVPLAEGTHALTATATDAAGNTSAPSATANVEVDRTAPLAPTVAPLLTSASNPVTITGTAEPGAAVTVYEGAAQLASGVAAGAGGAWSTAIPLAEGSHSLTAIATDTAGNVSVHSAPASVAVDRTAPAAPAVSPQTTNAANPVTISGTAEANATVTLYEGATLLASGFTAGAGGAWAAAVPLAPGTHGLTATARDAAGNLSPLSAAGNVVIDRTAPAVSATVPANLAANVWSRDPITVTFSEPMRASSATDSSVLLTRSGGTAIAKTLGLSADGLTLTIAPTSLPAVPDALQVTLTGGLTDVAGNPLAQTSWSWTLPEWQDLGAAWTGGTRSNIIAATLTLAVGPTGLPAVAAYSIGQISGGGVARYTGGAWEVLPAPAWELPSALSLAVGAGDLLTIAWANQANHVGASRYDGLAWSTPATLDIAQADPAAAPSIALDETGAPYAGWVETVGGVSQIFARRWNGSAWAQLGSGALSSATVAAAGPVALTGATRLTWTETNSTPTTTVKSNAYASGAWGATPFAAEEGPAQVGGRPSANAQGTVYLLDPGAVAEVYRWKPAAYPDSARWDPMGPGRAAAGNQAMGLDTAGLPVMAWSEGAGLLVSRYDAATSTWRSLTATALPATTRPVLAVGPTGVIALVAGEGTLNPSLRVWRYNR